MPKGFPKKKEPVETELTGTFRKDATNEDKNISLENTMHKMPKEHPARQADAQLQELGKRFIDQWLYVPSSSPYAVLKPQYSGGHFIGLEQVISPTETPDLYEYTLKAIENKDMH